MAKPLNHPTITVALDGTNPNDKDSGALGSPVRNTSPQESKHSSNSLQPSALATYRALGYSKIPYAPPLLRGKPQLALKALTHSNELSNLLERARDSQRLLDTLKSLLPSEIHRDVKSSTLEGDTWCLLVPNNAVMAKVRNMLPSLAAHLRAKGFDIKTIRLKIEGR
jgi:hypothetical protein